MIFHKFHINLTVTAIMLTALSYSTAKAQDNNNPAYRYTCNVIDNHYAVDLGLSVLWADCNVGANYPSEFGGLYGWTDATGNNTSINNNVYPSANPPMSICGNAKYDIARKKWGGAWKLPTKDEFNELIKKCTWELEVIGNSGGYIVTGPNGNKIFLPLAGQRKGQKNMAEYTGMYWSGNSSLKPCHGFKNAAYSLSLSAYNASTVLAPRFMGQSVRPVLPKSNVSTTTRRQTRTRSLEIITDCQTEANDVTTASRSKTEAVVSDCHSDKETVRTAHLSKIETVVSDCKTLPQTSATDSETRATDNDIDEKDILYPIPADSVLNRKHYYTGPYAIDLGLSVRWADRNLFATSPYDPGKLLRWADTTGKENSASKEMEWDENIPKEIAGTEYDIAHKKWKRKWRMPTADEMKELKEKCKWKWTKKSGASGYTVTGPNGNSIFLPLTGFRVGNIKKMQDENGFYWTSTRKDDERTIWNLSFVKKVQFMGVDTYYLGYGIRPVWE